MHFLPQQPGEWMALGLFIGFFVGLLLMVLNMHTYKRILIMKGNSNHPTAECIHGQFFYIVPESKYVELTSLRLQQRQRQGGRNRSRRN